uniref:Uncharacterized protein n=1 Tax=Anguilla anguilla TaxID=7936 RepID=A0A0E9WG65_ANGAN
MINPRIIQSKHRFISWKSGLNANQEPSESPTDTFTLLPLTPSLECHPNLMRSTKKRKL